MFCILIHHGYKENPILLCKVTHQLAPFGHKKALTQKSITAILTHFKVNYQDLERGKVSCEEELFFFFLILSLL